MGAGADILFSTYIIDGVEMDTTPAAMLNECVPQYLWEKFVAQWNSVKEPAASQEKGQDAKGDDVTQDVTNDGTIVDEAPDRNPVMFRYDPAKISDYARQVSEKLKSARDTACQINKFHPGFSTRILVATSVLQSLWSKAHTNLERLRLSATWTWDTAPLGNMAMFFASVEAATGYIYELGVHINQLRFDFVPGQHSAQFDALPYLGKASNPSDKSGSGNDSTIAGNNCGQNDSTIAGANCRQCDIPNKITNIEDTCLIYIPFDTCSHKLGGSVLGEILGGDEANPEISDPDYFIDCYEIVKELAEDGIVLSGKTVGRGGLITAVSDILGDNASIDLDINGIEQAYLESDPVRILFAEIPGVIIQIKDSDSDYVDSQFLLQDIAYYPIGYPVNSTRTEEKITLAAGKRTELANILSALMSTQPSEGED